MLKTSDLKADAANNWNSYKDQTVEGAEIAYKATPMGFSVIMENYTGQQLTWEKGSEARFKEKGREFETAVVGANTVGMANVIPTNPSDPKYDPQKLKYIGQPLSSDPEYKGSEWDQEGGGLSQIANPIPGMNSMSVFHDKFTQYTFLGAPGLLQLSIVPAIPINYYALIGKAVRNFYEKPNNNLTGGKP